MGLDIPTTATNTLGANKNTEPSNLCSSGNFGDSSCTESIYTIEQEIIRKLNTFYDLYATYIRCNNTITGSRQSGSGMYSGGGYFNHNNYNLNRQCNDITVTEDNVRGAYNNVISSIGKLNTAINSINDDEGSSHNSNITTSPSPLPDIDEIKQKYSNNLNLRNELDLKMKEILKTDDSFVNQSKLHYDSTMYASIGWTILATSLLYYVFRKL